MKTFRHGVHPPESKDETSGLPIRQFPFAPLLIIPLVQHMGAPSIPVVEEGQEGSRGQRIARPDGFMSVAMHASASGIVRKIALAPSISGRMVPAVYLEPFLTTDHRVMLEQSDDIFMGIRYLLKVSGAEKVIIAVEANKPDAAEHLRARFPADLNGSVEVLQVKYPQGAEKMLFAALLGREVPSGGLPLDVHALCCNVATTAEIGRLLPLGRGIQERVITVTGPAVKRKGNYRIPIGTPLRFLLEQVGVEEDVNRVFLGGPMMGAAVSSLDISITKGTSGVTAFTDSAAERTHSPVYPCIRCGYCVDVCPIFLNPSLLGRLAATQEFSVMAEQHNLMDCFECGSCSFVCPSHIPLVQQFRAAKSAVRKAAASRKTGAA
jgi:electron transport complex protein RnfC